MPPPLKEIGLTLVHRITNVTDFKVFNKFLLKIYPEIDFMSQKPQQHLPVVEFPWCMKNASYTRDGFAFRPFKIWNDKTFSKLNLIAAIKELI